MHSAHRAIHAGQDPVGFLVQPPTESTINSEFRPSSSGFIQFGVENLQKYGYSSSQMQTVTYLLSQQHPRIKAFSFAFFVN